MDDPYYQSEEYKAGSVSSAKQVMGEIPVDSVVMTVFTGVEESKFYIFTHSEIIIPAAQRFDNMINGINPS